MNPYGSGYPWYPTPYNPHIYLPPQFNNPYYQNPIGWQDPAHQQPKYPHLNPALAADTTHIRYDLRKAVRDGILISTYQEIGHQTAFSHPAHEVRIISKAFPWQLDIRLPTGSAITCSAIFEGLHKMLQEPIADSEWGIVMHEKSKKEGIEKAAKARHGKEKGKEMRLKRIDWLGETTAFKGLERDEEFEKKRLLPGTKEFKETWVVKFGKP